MLKECLTIMSIVVTFLACSDKKVTTLECQKQIYFEISMGTQLKNYESGINDIYIRFFAFLQNSDEDSAIGLLNKEADLIDLGYKGLKYRMPDKADSNRFYYMIYRLSEYLENIDPEHQSSILLKANIQNTLNENDSDNCLNKIAQIEFDYLSCYSDNDSLREIKIKNFYKNLNDYPSSLRLKYLWGKLNYDYKKFDVSISVFKDLLKENYYKKNILENLINYYNGKNADSLNYYAKVFGDNFPGKCNLGFVFTMTNTREKQNFLNECEKCFSSNNIGDSVRATLALGRYYLYNEDFKNVENLFEKYKTKNPQFILDSLKIYEAGEYYDISLQSLFLQKKYFEMYKFLTKNVGYNRKVIVNSENDFYLLIKNYYYKFNNQDSEQFEKFYEINFNWVNKDKFKHSFT